MEADVAVPREPVPPPPDDLAIVLLGIAAAARERALREVGRLHAAFNAAIPADAASYRSAFTDALYAASIGLRQPPKARACRIVLADGTTVQGLVLADLDGWDAPHRWVVALPSTGERVLVLASGSVRDAPASVHLHPDDLRALRGEG